MSARGNLEGLALDVRIARQQVWLNKLAGSSLTLRPLRWLMYRAAGMDVQTMNVFSGVQFTSSRVSIGSDTFINHGVYLDAGQGRISIGSGCMVGPQVMILTATHEIIDGHADHSETNQGVNIGDNVWLGARCIILPGVTIGAGSIIGSGSVVTRDCEPHRMYAGSPARAKRILRSERDDRGSG